MTPPLSIVVVSFNAPDLLEHCLLALDAQAQAVEAELLVIRGGGPTPQTEMLQRRFPRARWLTAPVGETVPRMRARAIGAAAGDVVALLEDDCVADPTWCAAVLAAHRGPWDAVGGAVEPGPYTRRSDWAVYFQEYGRFMLPFEQHDAAVLPGNNVSYKREALKRHGPLDADGFHEVFVHEAWSRAGWPMCMSPEVIVENRNAWPLAQLAVAPFHHGRVYAARRAVQQRWLRRVAHALGMPLLPSLQALRIAQRAAQRKQGLGRVALALPWIALFGTSWAMGEGWGSLLGAGTSARHWR